MITCKECRERLYPEDPSIPTGRYGHSTCDYFCDKFSYYRGLENLEIEPASHPGWMANQWDYVGQIKSEVTGWRQKHAELLLAIDKLKKHSKEQPF